MADLSLKGIARKYLSRSPPFDIRSALSIPTNDPSISLRSRLESIASTEHSFDFSEQCNGNTFGGYSGIFADLDTCSNENTT